MTANNAKSKLSLTKYTGKQHKKIFHSSSRRLSSSLPAPLTDNLGGI
nr:MAG TPA: hypothetical protein [Caudoviricetes sp.]DAO54844.1 MAG TPA: hypothetical protein [Caudoviricetes sp.]